MGTDTNREDICISCKCLTESIYGRVALHHQEKKVTCPIDVSQLSSFATIVVAKWAHEWRLHWPNTCASFHKAWFSYWWTPNLLAAGPAGCWTLKEAIKSLSGKLISLAPSGLEEATIRLCLERQSTIGLEHPCTFFLDIPGLQGPHSSYPGYFSEYYLQQSTLRNEVMSPSRTKRGLVYCLLWNNRFPELSIHQLMQIYVYLGLLSYLLGTRRQGELTSCCLLCWEWKIFASDLNLVTSASIYKIETS